MEEIVIKKNEIPVFETKKDLSNWVKKIFAELKTVTIKDTGISVILTGSGADRETQKRRSTREENKAVFLKFKEILETSIKLAERKADERHLHNQEIYFNKIQLDNNIYEVEIILDYLEKNKEYRYAGHKLNKITH